MTEEIHNKSQAIKDLKDDLEFKNKLKIFLVHNAIERHKRLNREELKPLEDLICELKLCIKEICQDFRSLEDQEEHKTDLRRFLEEERNLWTVKQREICLNIEQWGDKIEENEREIEKFARNCRDQERIKKDMTLRDSSDPNNKMPVLSSIVRRLSLIKLLYCNRHLRIRFLSSNDI
ncbi:MAG: hypothetical protein MHMPM18_004906 [Marteilia pararefringens]